LPKTFIEFGLFDILNRFDRLLFGLIDFWRCWLKVCLAGFNIVYFDICFVFVWLYNFWLKFALFWLI